MVMKTQFQLIGILSQVLGLILPFLATILIVEFGDRIVGGHVSGLDYLRLATMAAGIGVVSGMLLRQWWAVVLIPGEIIVAIAIAYIVDALNGGINEGRGGDPIPLGIILILFAGPFLILAALGTALGTAIVKHTNET